MTTALTAALKSAASLPVTCIANGMALNLKYTREDGDPDMLNHFVSTVKGYFDDPDGDGNGGMEVQFNVLTRESLVELARNPDPDSTLLVRVSGYTAYFKDLNPQMQQEVINRAEYRLSSGQAVSYPRYELSEREEC
jgi:formate C-acetyltransferase